MDGGTVGRLMNIDCAENIGYWHFVMSYVRGIHHRRDMSHSFLIAKGVHDLDLVCWFAGAPPKRVSSFGSLQFFIAENAPPGAPERCLDGCPVFESCEFNAYRQFVDPGQPDIPWRLLSGMSLGAARDFFLNPRFRSLAAVISRDISRDAVLKVLRETPYGRCVFRSDNEVVDHQTVSVEFENGVVASFQITGFSLIWERTLNLHGTKGEIRSADFSGRLETRTYNPARLKRERIRYHGIVHGGGDETIQVRFAEALQSGDRSGVLTGGRDALQSHLLCFAAEEARETGTVVDMEDFVRRAEREADL
jgi:predicted dehydrogenase